MSQNKNLSRRKMVLLQRVIRRGTKKLHGRPSNQRRKITIRRTRRPRKVTRNQNRAKLKRRCKSQTKSRIKWNHLKIKKKVKRMRAQRNKNPHKKRRKIRRANPKLLRRRRSPWKQLKNKIKRVSRNQLIRWRRRPKRKNQRRLRRKRSNHQQSSLQEPWPEDPHLTLKTRLRPNLSLDKRGRCQVTPRNLLRRLQKLNKVRARISLKRTRKIRIKSRRRSEY